MFPLAFTILWRKQSVAAAIIAPLLGLASGIAVWLVTAYVYGGELSITTTEAQLPCLWGAITSTFSSAIYSVIITYIKPQDFDWRIFLLLNEVKDEDSHSPDADDSESSEDNRVAVLSTKDLDSVQHPYSPEVLQRMKRAARIASVFSAVVGLVTWVVWPLPLYRDYIFTKPFFKGWTVVSEIWLFVCLLVATVYPIIDGRHVLAKACRLAWHSLVAGSSNNNAGQGGKESHPYESSTGIGIENEEEKGKIPSEIVQPTTSSTGGIL
ncbi:hypothetical protein VTN77DRAFT_2376 [Rasamsonia byssochlamydoides]|uniref:uncharacterized protein n=1 Tax=Rasamsonia byssochlamydoides TaxID=89139 RepID=UPI003742B149